jgi:hypothetical protein
LYSWVLVWAQLAMLVLGLAMGLMVRASQSAGERHRQLTPSWDMQ